MSELSERFYTTYSGVRLPLRLVGELDAGEIDNRNTYFIGRFDADERLVELRKVVYGEVELRHRYAYGDDGTLLTAEITDEDGEVTLVECK